MAFDGSESPCRCHRMAVTRQGLHHCNRTEEGEGAHT